MSTLKTQIDNQTVLEFLKKEFNKNITAVNPIKGGETSQAFFFTASNQKFVIRANTAIESFEKDKYAFEHFASDKIPIPEMIKLGQMSEKYYYAITKGVEGTTLDKVDEKSLNKILPQLMRVLDEIHKVDIGSRPKYGDWNRHGNASFNTWKEYILSIKDEKWFDWNELFKKSFMEKEVFMKTYNGIKKLTNHCPEERCLVHGDYGFNNLLTDGKRITGVIDWGESKYGDFLYDVAWLDFWTLNIKYAEEFSKHYQERNIDIPYYKERLLCYKLHLGLGALHFFVKSNQEKNYRWAKERILSIADIDIFTP